jgi:hypothetical protein
VFVVNPKNKIMKRLIIAAGLILALGATDQAMAQQKNG